MPVHSDWGNWLPREIADATPETPTVWYLGCNGVAIKGPDGTTLFIDPYLGTGDPPRTVRMIPIPFDPADVQSADALLATHEHTDHVHGPSQAPILEQTGADYVAPNASLDRIDQAGWRTSWDLDDTTFLEVAEGTKHQYGEFTVSVEPANDPDADHPVSYVVDHDAGTFFHGGDARPAEAFERIGDAYDLDLGILAFGSVGMIPDKATRKPTRTAWYSDEADVIEAAGQLELDRLIPSHWDMWRGLTADPTALLSHARSFPHPTRVDILEIGDRTTI